MSGAAVSLLTYIGHYVVARLLYDQLVRPLAHGHGSEAVAMLCVGPVGFALGRATGKGGRSRRDARGSARRRGA